MTISITRLGETRSHKLRSDLSKRDAELLLEHLWMEDWTGAELFELWDDNGNVICAYEN